MMIILTWWCRCALWQSGQLSLISNKRQGGKGFFGLITQNFCSHLSPGRKEEIYWWQKQYVFRFTNISQTICVPDWMTDYRFQIVKITTESTRHFSGGTKVPLGWDPWPGIPTPRSFKCLPELLSVCTNFTFRQNALVFLWISLSIFPESWVCFQIFLIFLEF